MNEEKKQVDHIGNFVQGFVGLEYKRNFPLKNNQDRVNFIPYAIGSAAKIFLGGVLVFNADDSLAQQLLGLGIVGDSFLTMYRPIYTTFKKPPCGLVGMIMNYVSTQKK